MYGQAKKWKKTYVWKRLFSHMHSPNKIFTNMRFLLGVRYHWRLLNCNISSKSKKLFPRKVWKTSKNGFFPPSWPLKNKWKFSFSPFQGTRSILLFQSSFPISKISETNFSWKLFSRANFFFSKIFFWKFFFWKKNLRKIVDLQIT